MLLLLALEGDCGCFADAIDWSDFFGSFFASFAVLSFEGFCDEALAWACFVALLAALEFAFWF